MNEDSLKRLSEYVASLQVSGKAQPTELVFYIRKHNESPESFSGKLNFFMCIVIIIIITNIY